MLPKKVKNPWNRYCELMRRHPKAFVQSDGLPIITDPFAVSEFANQTGVEIGVIYESPVWFWVVDLVQGPEGLVASERLLPVRKEAEVVAIPVYNDRYFVLVEEGRQVLQNAQLAFPRGEGIPGMSPAQNAAERLAEALQAEVLSYGMLGSLSLDEASGGGSAYVILCRITQPDVGVGDSGLPRLVLCSMDDLKWKIAAGEIGDLITLGAYGMLAARI